MRVQTLLIQVCQLEKEGLLGAGVEQKPAGSCSEAQRAYLCDSLCPRDIQMTMENTIMPAVST